MHEGQWHCHHGGDVHGQKENEKHVDVGAEESEKLYVAEQEYLQRQQPEKK